MSHVRPRQSVWPLSRRKRSPRGFAGLTVTEVIVSTILLSAAMLTIGPLLSHLVRNSRRLDQHELALHEVQNHLESLSGVAYDDLTPQRCAAEMPSDSALRGLPGVRLQVLLTVLEGAPRAKRLRVDVDWKNDAGTRAGQIGLSAWVYEQTEAE